MGNNDAVNFLDVVLMISLTHKLKRIRAAVISDSKQIPNYAEIMLIMNFISCTTIFQKSYLLTRRPKRYVGIAKAAVSYS